MKPDRCWCCRAAVLLATGLALATSGVSAVAHLRSGVRGVSLATKQASNPLLDPGQFPNFAGVKPEYMKPAVEERLKDGAVQLKTMEDFLASKENEVVPYDELVLPLERLYEHVGKPWGMISHLKSVRDTPALREVSAEMQPKVTAFWQGVSQSKPIYQALVRLNASAGFAELPEARRRVVHSELLDRKLGGVALQGEAAVEFNGVQQRLGTLSTEFSNHVLDATKAWNLTVTDKHTVRGVPARALAAMAAAAKASGEHPDATAEKGPWVLSLDGTVLGPVLTYAEDRDLRERLFRVSAKKASSGPSDNTGTIGQILASRQREAELLGFGSFADLSLASKMAKKEEVHKLLSDLGTKAKPAALRDDQELRDFAKSKDQSMTDLKHWDRGFFAEKLRQERYGVDSEKLRVYFPFPGVIEGLFGLASRLFDATVEPADDAAPQLRWHEDVRVYRVRRAGFGGAPATEGFLAFDPYVRSNEKRPGAWVQPLVARRHLEGAGETADPVAVIVCNFPQPQGGQPSLLSLGEVETLFHEFGHALQHVLTVQNEAPVSGLNGIEWDAVEIASQFMEYWVELDRTTLYSFAKHYQTKEPLPDETYASLRKAMHFRAGTMMTGQVFMGTVDLRLHEKYQKGEDANAIAKQIAKEVLVVQPLPEARLLCSFSHIFAGGYAAGYYSYQWSKVLSADAFSAFDEAGLDNAKKQTELGRKFAATYLGLGGGRDPAKVFVDFRGRSPTSSALLRYSGLAGEDSPPAGLL